MVYCKRFGLFLLLCMIMSVGTVWAATPFSAPYTHYSEKEELANLLTDFARSQGLSVTLSPLVVGKVSGRFENVAPVDFLNGMKSAFGVAWYTQGRALHFYHEAELSRTFLSPRVLSAQALYDMLRNSSVLSPQLPAEIMNGNMLVLSGPPAYLDQIRMAVAAFEEAQTSNFVMQVFPLKYAWAEDIQVNSMDAVVTIPGIATILRAMVTGNPVTGSTITQLPATVPALLGQGMAAQGKPQAAATPAASGPQAVGAPGEAAQRVNIIADPRVNSILITDAEYRMPYYAKVIADLDKPVQLVEIHAAIVDIDSNYERDLGVNFQGAVSNKNVNGWGDSSSTAGKDVTPPTGPQPFLGSGLSLSTLYTNGADYFLARIQAMEATGAARMLGRPSVLTMDNVQATLENTQSYYVKLEGKDVVDLFKVEAGTVLKVTPHIIPSSNGGFDSIKLVVSVQDDQNDGSSGEGSAGSVLPPIKQTKINTQAIVNEGQSLLIGGYYYEKKQNTETGIPGLMSIPIIGNLFKTQGKTSKRMERLILITPRIVRLDDLPAPPERVNDASFHRSATQGNYEEQIPVPAATGGCARKQPSLPAVPVLTPVLTMTIQGGSPAQQVFVQGVQQPGQGAPLLVMPNNPPAVPGLMPVQSSPRQAIPSQKAGTQPMNVPAGNVPAGNVSSPGTRTAPSVPVNPLVPDFNPQQVPLFPTGGPISLHTAKSGVTPV